MIAPLVIIGIFLAAFATTLWANASATFTYVLLPVLLLVFTVSPLELHGLPDVTSMAAVGYGTVAAFIFKGGEPLGFRFHLIDAIVLLLSAVGVVANAMSEQLWTGVSAGGQEFFTWLVPYFMGRSAFTQQHYRLRAAQVLCGLAIPLSVIALYELRIDPYFYSRRLLQPFGLTTTAWVMVLQRYNLFRAQVSFSHPIDLGNGGALLACLIIVLACTAGRRLTTPWVAMGVGAAMVMTLASLSFTSFVAAGGIAAIFVAARVTRLTGLALLPASVVVIVVYAMFTLHLVNTPIELPDDPNEALNSSYYIRHFIVQQAWPYVSTAGLWGWGPTFDVRTTGLESLDNAYLFFVLRQGWLYLVVFLCLLTVVTIYGGMALMRIRDGKLRIPIAAGVAGLVGTMLGMYTVFFGFVYARLFIILLGLTVTMCQRAFARTAELEAGPQPAKAAFASAPVRPRAMRQAVRA